MRLGSKAAQHASISSQMVATSIASVLTLGLLAGVFGALLLFLILRDDQMTKATNLAKEIPRLALSSLVDGDYHPVASKLEVFRSSGVFSFVSVSDARGGPVAAFGERSSSVFEACDIEKSISDENGVSWGAYQYCYNRLSLLMYAALAGLSFFILMLFFAFVLAKRLNKKILNQGSQFNLFLDRLKEQTDMLKLGEQKLLKNGPPALAEEQQIDAIVSGLITEIRNQIRRQELMSVSLIEAQTRNTVSRRVAHDIKSPLSAIKIVSDYLTEGSKEKSLAKQAIKRIEGVLGELSNAERGSHTAISWKNSVNLIETVFMEKRAVYPNIKIRMDIDQYLEDDFLVAGEAVGLGRIFSNIIQNAIEATSDLNLQLNVRVVRTGSGLRFHFIDNGTGFVQDLVGTFGIGELTTKNNGQGIGLSSAAEYLAAIAGTLKLSNLPGGAEVIVELPVSNPMHTLPNGIIKK